MFSSQPAIFSLPNSSRVGLLAQTHLKCCYQLYYLTVLLFAALFFPIRITLRTKLLIFTINYLDLKSLLHSMILLVRSLWLLKYIEMTRKK